MAVTDALGLTEGILLRLADRLVEVELRVATNATSMQAMTDNGSELRHLVTDLAHDVGELRALSSDTKDDFEKMRGPLQALLDLQTKISGAWLAITALLMVLAYLLQPFLGELVRLHTGRS